MRGGAQKRDDDRQPKNDHAGWHLCVAAAVLFVAFFSLGACGDEDFTVGGPLPTFPTVDATNPSVTPDDF